MLLELSFFLNDVDSKSGIIRTFITEEARIPFMATLAMLQLFVVTSQEPLHPRFKLTAGVT